MVDKKVAVYLCRGCDIGDSLDVEALGNVATENGADLCREHECLCGEAGLELIKQDVREGANALVVAACSPRFKTDEFTFEGCRTERVNLREHVVWSHKPNDEDTQMLAEDYLRIGITRTKKAELPTPFEEEIDKTILDFLPLVGCELPAEALSVTLQALRDEVAFLLEAASSPSPPREAST